MYKVIFSEASQHDLKKLPQNIKKHRAAFSIENITIIFHKIRHRREIYKRN